MPSSSFLAKKMLRNIDFASADVIVEFGPGNGAITNNYFKKTKSNSTINLF